MERFQEARDKAKRNLQIADHMAYMTYSLVKDPRLLVVVMENLFLALTNAMSSVLHYERFFKRLEPFPENFEAKFTIFQNCAIKYSIDKSYLSMIRDIKEFIYEHKRSPMEFTRKDRYVICTDNYKMKAISLDKIKRYILLTRNFLQITNSIVGKDEGILR
ncbi:MAG: hypothetical protein ABIF10_08055 [Candidatus Woesearchaeota archaeon]